MDSDDDYQSLSPPNDLTPQLPLRRLKRLKKSDTKSPRVPLFDSTVDPILFSHVDFAKLEAMENQSEPHFADEANLSQDSISQGVGNEQILGEPDATEKADLSQESMLQGVGNETENGDEMDLGFDVDVKKTKRVLDFDDDVVDGSAIGERTENLEAEKKGIIGEEVPLEKKEEIKKNKKREKSDGGDEWKPNSKGSNKRKEEKERKTYLKELHAESQRLLRETGDASFKPIPVVQKPISSVLEKIRKRKLEVLRKSVISNDTKHDVERNIRQRDRPTDLYIPDEERLVEKESSTPLDDYSGLACSNATEDDTELGIHENAQNQLPPSEEPTPAHRAPADNTQDLFDDSEPTDSRTLHTDEKRSSPLDEDFAPSLHSMNLKLDSVPVDDSLSEEEDNDKETFDAHPCGVADNSSPNGDPVKGFIDEEAEEEDDSDNDLTRFQENEVDEDIDDLDELNDIIATDFEERCTDKEARNELHHKWLEQQDEAGTDNLIQRLKCGSILRDAFLTDNEDETDDEDDEKDDEIDNEAEKDSLPKESSTVNIRKAKEIILKLYSGKEDTYLSDDDDDDDMQRRRAQCLIRKEERTTITSPAADASSKEVFGLIKKLNIASDNKKKPKALCNSIFDSVLKGGSSGSSIKSSFVGQVSNHQIPSSHKQRSATVRSFIFGRGDSNSRSSLSISDESSNSVTREIRPTKNLVTNYSNSQTKVRIQTKDGDVETISKTSLLEILKRSSSQSKACNEETSVDLTKSIFAFRAPKRPIKMEGRGQL